MFFLNKKNFSSELWFILITLFGFQWKSLEQSVQRSHFISYDLNLFKHLKCQIYDNKSALPGFVVSLTVPKSFWFHVFLSNASALINVPVLFPLCRMGATVFVQPLDLVKNRMQLSGQGTKAREYKTSFHALFSILRNEGVGGIYTGYQRFAPSWFLSF